MKRIFSLSHFFLILLVLECSSFVKAQIFEPEGLNIPGTWNNFINPPASASPFGSEFQVNQGGVRLINTGTRRWQAGFYCNNDSGVSSGAQNFLFTSGSASNPFGNKWSGTNVTFNQIQSYAYNNNALPDNSVELDSNFYYTINWRDAGYATTEAIFMKTSSEPVELDSLFTAVSLNQVLPNQEIAVTLHLSAIPSSEERFYLRYSFDSFAGSTILPMLLQGNTATAVIPGFQAGAEIDFYAFSSSVINPTGNYDLQTLRFINNNGLNYGYSVINQATLLNLGPDFGVCAGSGPWDLAVSAVFDSYTWSTGSTDSAIVISEPGTYAVQVTLGAITVSDTITVSLIEVPDFSLGADITQCNTGPIELNSGVFAGPAGDEITIVYDATQGQTQLANLDTTNDRVYMHSGYEAVPFGGPVSWVGNWGQDDGLGAMTYIGNNRWSITFNVFDYYSIAGNEPISGLFIVFRNADGSLTGKDNNGNDIFLSLQQNPPNSAFGGIEASIEGSGIESIVWNTGAQTSSITLVQSGNYSATLTNFQGCTVTDSVNITLLDVPTLTVSNDTTLCTGTFEIALQASGAFDSFEWSNGAVTSTIAVNSEDAYAVTATAANGCTRTDTVNVAVSLFSIASQLNESYLSCGGEPVSLNTGILLSPQGDSLTIVYDATQGQSQLQGAAAVYMHSTFEYAPFAGGVLPWVGNWGQDDGIGEMTSLGNDVWTITINVYDYYNVPLDSSINGLFIVFRNADGSLTGKDELGNDVFLNLSTQEPSSSFSGITGTVDPSDVVAINWSDGSSNPVLTTTLSGSYSVSVVADNGCVLTDTATVLAVPGAQVSLGADRILCSGESTNLNAGNGFVSYSWSTGAAQNAIVVSTTGTYSVEVTTAEGCTGEDSVNVQVINPPVASFTVGPIADSTVAFIDLSSGPANYAWDFESDGIVDNSLNGDVNHVYSLAGDYTVTLILTNFCGADTATAAVSITPTSIDAWGSKLAQFVLFPNPTNAFIRINGDLKSVRSFDVIDFSGRLMLKGTLDSPSSLINVSALPLGIYLVRIFDNENELLGQSSFAKQ